MKKALWLLLACFIFFMGYAYAKRNSDVKTVHLKDGWVRYDTPAGSIQAKER